MPHLGRLGRLASVVGSTVTPSRVILVLLVALMGGFTPGVVGDAAARSAIWERIAGFGYPVLDAMGLIMVMIVGISLQRINTFRNNNHFCGSIRPCQ